MKQLPTQFADLTPFTNHWGLSSQEERHLALIDCTLDELRPFYEALMGRMDSIIHYLNGFDLKTMPHDAQNLLDLALTWAETAHPLDLKWKTTDIDDSFPASRIEYLAPSAKVA
jgi:hypothetical protein